MDFDCLVIFFVGLVDVCSYGVSGVYLFVIVVVVIVEFFFESEFFDWIRFCVIGLVCENMW